jgi:hypothetical protein
MLPLNKVICEYPLPIPVDKLNEEGCEDFKDIKWDEFEFFTSSFFDYDIYAGEPEFPTYTISEDGQFYKESDSEGVELQEFTGQIFFGSQIFGEKIDYDISFVALFYKGELKEVDLNKWEKESNKKRKKLQQSFVDEVAKLAKKKIGIGYRLFCPIRWTVLKIAAAIKWVMYQALLVLLAVESWIRR